MELGPISAQPTPVEAQGVQSAVEMPTVEELQTFFQRPDVSKVITDATAWLKINGVKLSERQMIVGSVLTIISILFGIMSYQMHDSIRYGKISLITVGFDVMVVAISLTLFNMSPDVRVFASLPVLGLSAGLLVSLLYPPSSS